MKKIIVLLLCLGLVGCATAKQFSKAFVGMSKEEARKTIGSPDALKGSIINKYGQLVEVWEYSRYKGGGTIFHTPTKYWFYFVNHKSESFLCEL